MKRGYLPVALLIVLFLMLFMYGCDLLPMSIEGRINSFESDINNDRSHAYLNFDPTLTGWYGLITSASYWDLPFPTDKGPYSITVVDSSIPTNVTCTITGVGYTFGPEIIFKMTQDGSNWLIEEIPSMELYTGKVVD